MSWRSGPEYWAHAMPTPPHLLTTTQMERLSPHFPLSHRGGKTRA